MLTTDLGAVTSLWRYPVSSLGGQKCTSLQLSPAGVEGDRTHALADPATGKAINPAEQQWQAAPRILSRLAETGLEISFDGTRWIPAGAPETQEKMGQLFGKPVALRPYAAKVDAAHTTHRYPLSPVHLVSIQALASLRTALPDSHVDERRFRPNLVVDLPHTLDPLPEYNLIGREFRVGALRLRGVVKAGRCNFTTLQQLGMTADRAILQTLLSRFQRDFGIYCEVLGDGEIALGDRLAVVANAEPPSRIVIVGAGQAGGAAARALREAGFSGQITVLGDEGLPPYERPPLSKSFVLDRPTASGLSGVLPAADAAQLKVELSLGDPVVRLDRLARRVETGRGQSIPYDKLILATGGLARGIPGLDRGHGRIHLLRTAQDAEALRLKLTHARSVFVLGSGWLGLEVAAAAREHGLKVTLFGRQDHVCARALPPTVAEVVAGWHETAGVQLRLGSDPRFVEHSDRVEATLTTETMTADLLVVAIGIAPNEALARQAGLACDDGILTDADGATSDPDVFAIGDVSRQPAGVQSLRIESWQNANDQALRAARAILGLENLAPGLPRFWSEQFGHMLHIAGLPRPGAALLSGEADGSYMEFDGFAVGIDAPTRVHRYAVTHHAKPDDPAEIEIDDRPPSGTRPHPFDLQGPLAEGELRKVRSALLGDLVVTRVGKHLFAVEEHCPHAAASFTEGMVSGLRIVCPLHFAEFDLRDGSAHRAPNGCRDLRTWRVTEDADRASIWVSEEEQDIRA